MEQQCVGQGDAGGGVGVGVERRTGPVRAAGAYEEADGGPAGVRVGVVEPGRCRLDRALP
ncbi:hypothetical protein RB199_37280 [Streptomyces libani]